MQQSLRVNYVCDEMRTLPFFLFAGLLFFAASCGMESVVSNELMSNDDSVKTADSIVALKNDTVPHEVRKGKKSTYAYLPDTSFGTLVIGNADSFQVFWRHNGANIVKTGENRYVASFYNSERSEWVAVYLLKNKKHRETPYGIVVQKANQIGAPRVPGDPLVASKANFVSGHQVYIGMPLAYVMSIYTDQALMQWQSGDTLYLQYKPEAKDAPMFHRYSWQQYSATYKFVNGRLRRIEYFADPAAIETR